MARVRLRKRPVKVPDRLFRRLDRLRDRLPKKWARELEMPRARWLKA